MMESVSLNILTKVLAYLTAPDIVIFSTINRNIIETFECNFVLWDLVLKAKPIGYARTSSYNKGKLHINACRENCISVLRIYYSCCRTSSIGLLLSTLALYTDCHQLCFDIYNQVLRLSLSIDIDDHKTKLLIYEAFIKEFNLYSADYHRICKAMDVYKNLISNYQTKRNISEDHHFQPSIAVVAAAADSTANAWASDIPDTIHNRNDDRMCKLLVQCIRQCAASLVEPIPDIRLKLSVVESSQACSQANLDTLNTAITTCINLSIFPTQAACMIQMDLPRMMRKILLDIVTTRDTNVNCIVSNKLVEHVMYLLINLTDKRNIDSHSLQVS